MCGEGEGGAGPRGVCEIAWVRMWEVEGSIRERAAFCFVFLCGVPSIAESLVNRGIVCRVSVYRRVCFGCVVASASAVGDRRRVPSAYYG